VFAGIGPAEVLQVQVDRDPDVVWGLDLKGFQIQGNPSLTREIVPVRISGAKSGLP